MKKVYRLATTERIEATSKEQALDKLCDYAKDVSFFGSLEEAESAFNALPTPEKSDAGYRFDNHGKIRNLYFYYDTAILELAEAADDYDDPEELFENASWWGTVAESVAD
ncbi:MAG: hypothetical protein MJY78_11255 [Fibrobacter sp.]|nr:hypothetical protein [Fibrobacter sp.]